MPRSHRVSERGYNRYIAVATFPSSSFTPTPSPEMTVSRPACIQLWSYGPCEKGSTGDLAGINAHIKCQLVLCIDEGPAYEMKWCPLPSHDSVRDAWSSWLSSLLTPSHGSATPSPKFLSLVFLLEYSRMDRSRFIRFPIPSTWVTMENFNLSS